MQIALLSTPGRNSGGVVRGGKLVAVPHARPARWVACSRSGSSTHKQTSVWICRQITRNSRLRLRAAGFSDPAESLRRYQDLDIDHFDRSSNSLLHQDVLDILPHDVHLDPRGLQSELDVHKLTNAGNRLSEVWSRSAIPSKLSSSLAQARPLAANASSNRLALQCAMFCFLLATRQTERYGKFDVYVITVLCHQVGR